MGPRTCPESKHLNGQLGSCMRHMMFLDHKEVSWAHYSLDSRSLGPPTVTAIQSEILSETKKSVQRVGTEARR